MIGRYIFFYWLSFTGFKKITYPNNEWWKKYKQYGQNIS